MNHCSTQMNFVNPLRNYVNGRWLDVLKDVYFIHKIWNDSSFEEYIASPMLNNDDSLSPLCQIINIDLVSFSVEHGTLTVMEFLKRSKLMNDDWKLRQLHAVQVKVHSQRMKQRDFGKVEPQVLDWHTIQVLWTIVTGIKQNVFY